MRCIITGRINVISGRVRTIHRAFETDSFRTLRGDALACLAKRKDGGAPWFGDAVTVTTPGGYEVIVDVPWPTNTAR